MLFILSALTFRLVASSVTCSSLSCPAQYLQDTDCDSMCNTELCNYDSLDSSISYSSWSCIDDCLEETWCEPELLGDGTCQQECISYECGLDRGDCGFCAVSCYLEMIGNGVCDQECKNLNCGFDDGDCLDEECAKGCVISMINDGTCQAECDRQSCNYDGMDCVSETSCSIECKKLQGNGQCDEECDIEECAWDAGECLCGKGCTPDVRDSKDLGCDKNPCNVAGCYWHDGRCGVCNSGCHQDMLDNNICDEACRVKDCNYDNGKCNTCSPGCADSVKGKCKPECLTGSCNWDTYNNTNYCKNPSLRTLYKGVQAVNQDWSLNDIEQRCQRTGCDLLSYLAMLAKSPLKCINPCNNIDCAYSFGACSQTVCYKDCQTCYGGANGECISCKPSYMQFYTYCLTTCPPNYHLFDSICIHDETSTESSPANSYLNSTSDLVLNLALSNNRYQTIHLSRGNHLIKPLERPLNLDLSYLDPSTPLLKPGNDISLIIIQPWICGSSVSELCYIGDLEYDDRPVMKWTAWVSFNVRKGSRLVISSINLYGRYSLITTSVKMYEDYCPYLQTRGDLVTDQRGTVYKADLIPSESECEKYKSLALFNIDSSRLSLSDVKISYFRMQPRAIILAIGKSTIDLKNVDFEFIRVSTIMKSGVISLDECFGAYLPYNCAELRYENGSIYALNDGYELEAGVILSGFLYANGAMLIDMKEIDISYSLVYSSNTEGGFINLSNFKQIKLENITVSYSVIALGLVNVFGNISFDDTVDDQGRMVDHYLTHIDINNLKIQGCYSRTGILMNAAYSSDLQNISLNNLSIQQAFSNSLIHVEA